VGRHQGRGVHRDRDTINRAIWSDVAVTDDSITQCVRDIRRAIGDDAQRLLKTVPRRGYLLTADVVIARDPPATPSLPGLALPDRPSLVVLPFQNMSGDPEQRWQQRLPWLRPEDYARRVEGVHLAAGKRL
jgi:DNA-binding winged helix-turn-helix (wHTH) protein